MALAGGLAAYLYSAGPVRLAYRGVGRLAVGASFGPLLVIGAYLVQTGTVSLAAALASLPVGLLIAAVLYINQFPDYEADKAVGKRHWVVRLGTERALPVLTGLVFGAHLAVLGAVVTGHAPWPVLAALLTVPVSMKALRISRVHHASPVELRPANALASVST